MAFKSIPSTKLPSEREDSKDELLAFALPMQAVLNDATRRAALGIVDLSWPGKLDDLLASYPALKTAWFDALDAYNLAKEQIAPKKNVMDAKDKEFADVREQMSILFRNVLNQATNITDKDELEERLALLESYCRWEGGKYQFNPPAPVSNLVGVKNGVILDLDWEVPTPVTGDYGKSGDAEMYEVRIDNVLIMATPRTIATIGVGAFAEGAHTAEVYAVNDAGRSTAVTFPFTR